MFTLELFLIAQYKSHEITLRFCLIRHYVHENLQHGEPLEKCFCIAVEIKSVAKVFTVPQRFSFAVCFYFYLSIYTNDESDEEDQQHIPCANFVFTRRN